MNETEKEPVVNNDPRVGERWVSRICGRTCRVMADPVEGYVMYRFRGAMPMLLHKSAWHQKFTPSHCAGKK